MCKVDSKVVFDAYNKQDSTNNLFITNICKELFWFQIEYAFILKLELVESKLNLAGPFTREDRMNDLQTNFYFKVWDRFGPFQVDLMASSTNVKCDSMAKKLRFFSRYFTQKVVKGWMCLRKI